LKSGIRSDTIRNDTTDDNGERHVKTIRDAMERLKVNKSRVHWFISQGRLRATQTTGGLWLIEPRELERFARIPRRPGKQVKKTSRRLVDKR